MPSRANRCRSFACGKYRTWVVADLRKVRFAKSLLTHLEFGTEAEFLRKGVPDGDGECAAGGLVVASAEGAVCPGGGVVAEEADEVDVFGGAAGEVDVAGAEAGVYTEDDGAGEAGSPDLGYERVDLAGGVHAEGNDVCA